MTIENTKRIVNYNYEENFIVATVKIQCNVNFNNKTFLLNSITNI